MSQESGTPAQFAAQLLTKVVKKVRPEEWALLALWSVGMVLCLRTNSGFNFWNVFVRYFRYFAPYIVVLVALARVTSQMAEWWRPTSERGQRFRRIFFGEAIDTTRLRAADFEFMRGCCLLFANLSVYSNVKIRIPAINGTVGDEFFKDLDDKIVGRDFAPWIEKLTRETPWLNDFLADTYTHDYFWMVLLVAYVYLRRDLRSMRWIFGATALTYITAILITVIHPSYGPFYLEKERFTWIEDNGVARAQKFLRKTARKTAPGLIMGEPIRARPFAGIAAFPSLHVGHMVIMTMVAARMLPAYAVWMLGVTAVTTLATLAFGWHYFVDALGGAILAVACTQAVYMLIKRAEARAGEPEGDEAPRVDANT